MRSKRGLQVVRCGDEDPFTRIRQRINPGTWRRILPDEAGVNEKQCCLPSEPMTTNLTPGRERFLGLPEPRGGAARPRTALRSAAPPPPLATRYGPAGPER